MNLHPEKTTGRVRTDSLSSTANSIKQELAEAADLAGKKPVLAVHTIRKRLKLFRAFLKLLKDFSDIEKYEAANAFLRDQGRSFSLLRDAHVRTETMEYLLTEPVFMPNRDSIEKFLELNAAETKNLHRAFLSEENKFLQMKSAINHETEVSDFINSVDLKSVNLFEGLGDAFERCCSAYYSGCLHPTVNHKHEWRKRVKDLQYQYELMDESIPDGISPTYDDLHAISELLGQDQDLKNLGAWIGEQAAHSEKNESNALISSLKSRRNRLKASIDHLGKVLFSTDPDEYRNMLINFAQNGKR